MRAQGAVPAPVAVLGGALTVGLSESEWRRVCSGETGKASRRDLPVLLANGGSGAATAAALPNTKRVRSNTDRTITFPI